MVPTFFVIGALWLSLTHRALVAHGSLALAVLSKVYPLVFFPLLLWRTWQLHGHRKTVSGGVLVAVITVVGYLLFVDAGPSLWQGTQTFAERWQTNSLLFRSAPGSSCQGCWDCTTCLFTSYTTGRRKLSGG